MFSSEELLSVPEALLWWGILSTVPGGLSLVFLKKSARPLCADWIKTVTECGIPVVWKIHS